MPSAKWSRSSQKRHRPTESRSAACGSRRSAKASAARRLSCSLSSVRSPGSSCSTRARHQSRWRRRTRSRSPDAARRSAAYWRMVSSSRRRAPGHDQRLVDQPRDQPRDPAAVDGAAGADLLGGLQGEAAGEDGQAPEEHALLAGEQVVAPVDGGAQRLLARARRAAATGQDVEAVAEACRDLVERERATRAAASSMASGMPSRRRQMSSIVASSAGRAEPGAAAARSTNRRPASASDGTRQVTSPGQRSGSRLVARIRRPGPAEQPLGEAAQASTRCSQLSSTRKASRAGQVRGERVVRRALRGKRDAERQGRGLGDERAVVEAGELDQPDAVGPAARRRLEGEARLAGAAGAGERQQPGASAVARSRPARGRGRRTT